MSLAEDLFDMAVAMQRVAAEEYATPAISAAEMETATVARLRAALEPFVAAYEERADPIGDSDLDNEQPRGVFVTLGDCRRAAMVLARARRG